MDAISVEQNNRLYVYFDLQKLLQHATAASCHRVFCAFLVCLLCGYGLVASPSSVGATCAVGWHQQSAPTDPPFVIVSAGANWNGYMSVNVNVVGVTDPVRGFAAQGWIPASNGNRPSVSSGTCLGYGGDGIPIAQNSNGSFGQGGWPPALLSAWGNPQIPQILLCLRGASPGSGLLRLLNLRLTLSRPQGTMVATPPTRPPR